MYKYQRIDLLEVQAGVNFELNLLIGAVLPLVGCTARVQVRRFASDYRVALTLDVSIVGQQLLLSKSAAGMRIAAGAYVWDVRITNSAGTEFTFIGGKFEAVNVVTK